MASDLAERILEIFPVKSRVLSDPVVFSSNFASLTCPQIIRWSVQEATRFTIDSMAFLMNASLIPSLSRYFKNGLDYIFYFVNWFTK